MKRVFAMILLCCLASAAAVRAESPFPPMLDLHTPAVSGTYANDDALVRAAIRTLRSRWQREFSEGHYAPGEYRIDIRGVRLVRIKEDLPEKMAEYFGSMDCVVDFLMLDDYYSTAGSGYAAGYLEASRMNCYVVVYRTGVMEVSSSSPFRRYIGRTYDPDLSALIADVADFGDQYNQVFTFTAP